MFKARNRTSGGRSLSPDSVTNTDLANMAAGTVKGRALGSGTGDPQDLTAAQLRAIVESAGINEVEESGAGPFNDYAPSTAGARHIMCSNAAGVFTGVSATNYVVGDAIVFSHQGTGYTEFQHNTGSAVGNVFFTGRQGRALRIFDNEIAVFRYLDTATGGTAVTRWELQCPLFPWAQSSADAAGDIIAHNGTNYVAVAGGNSADVVLRGNATFGTVSAAALANASVSPAKLATISSNIAASWFVYIDCPSGGSSGTPDDVTIWSANAPFALRILDAQLRVSTAVGGSSAALRTASGGGGSVVLPDPAAATQTFSTAATGVLEDLSTATATVAANGSLFLRRSDRSVVGELVLTCIRT